MSNHLRLSLSVLTDNRINVTEGCVNFLSVLGSSENEFARDKNENDNARLDHSKDQTREKFGFVCGKIAMDKCERFQANMKANIAATNHILNLEIGKLCLEAQLLNDTGILS